MGLFFDTETANAVISNLSYKVEMKNKLIICQHCHSKYYLNSERLNWRDTDSINCTVCNQELFSWSEAKIYTATLIERGS